MEGSLVEDESPLSVAGMEAAVLLAREDNSRPAAATATFEERFEQFYLQLSEGKTGGMVVR